MADKILCDKTDLVNIANAVRNKNGTANTYYVSELGTAVQNIQTAPSLQAKEVNITANGTTNVAADAGYEGLSGVIVNANVEPSVSNLFVHYYNANASPITFIYVGKDGFQTLSLGTSGTFNSSSGETTVHPIIGSLVVATFVSDGYSLDASIVAGLESIHSLTVTSYIRALVYRVTGSDSQIYFNISCLIAGTLITLADGSTKPVEDITYDDDLLVWDFFNGCFASAKPRWIKVKQTADVYNKLTFDNGTTLGLVGEGGTQGYHRIFNKQACCFTHTGVPETPNGTITFAEDKSEPVLVSQELIHDTVDYYNIITDKHFNLFANGILTSCKCSNMYRIEDMKYVGERLMSDEDIKDDFAWRESLKLPNSKGGAIL